MLAKTLFQNKSFLLLYLIGFFKCIASSDYTVRAKHTLPDLPYGYSELEPVISGEIMRLHHQKHHAAYVANLNAAEEKLCEAQAKNDTSSVIKLLPVIKFNGGGHINHALFWQVLTPKGTSEPQGNLAAAIKRDFGSFDNLVQQLTSLCVGIQGSGWGWLGYNKQYNRLELASCANQDPLLATTGLFPLFGIDVWEHAYYLQYKNVRADYVKNIFKIANWRRVEEFFENAQK